MSRFTALLILALMVPACSSGGGGGGSAASTVVFRENFSEMNADNWNGNMTLQDGNPPPGGITTGNSTTVLNFDFTGGLSISWQFAIGILPAGYQNFGGLNSGTAGAPGYGAGIGISVGTYNWSFRTSYIWQCYLNGQVVFETGLASGGPLWHLLKVTILPDGTVEYYVDGGLVYTSTAPVGFPSPKDVVMNGEVDNILITVP